MKAVLLSTRPKYCGLIAEWEKGIEARKTRPKLETPFKCYIYCTSPKYPHEDFIVIGAGTENARAFYGGGKVIGEFVCDEIETYVKVGYTGMGEDPEYWSVDSELRIKSLPLAQICLTNEEFYEYANGAKVFGWHISDLVIYDEPKELSEFNLTHPPQSWCYVEELT